MDEVNQYLYFFQYVDGGLGTNVSADGYTCNMVLPNNAVCSFVDLYFVLLNCKNICHHTGQSVGS